jgi:hypothetical protein
MRFSLLKNYPVKVTYRFALGITVSKAHLTRNLASSNETEINPEKTDDRLEVRSSVFALSKHGRQFRRYGDISLVSVICPFLNSSTQWPVHHDHFTLWDRGRRTKVQRLWWKAIYYVSEINSGGCYDEGTPWVQFAYQHRHHDVERDGGGRKLPGTNKPEHNHEQQWSNLASG